jgi:valyl-tRNA synthetase
MQATLLENAVPRDRYILSKLNTAVTDMTYCFEHFKFGESVKVLEQFFKDYLCDVYLELIKPAVYAKGSDEATERARNQSRAVLWTCLDVGLRLLHPICPFVTEELWQRLPGRGMGLVEDEKTSIMISTWPKAIAAWENKDAENAMEQFVLPSIDGARSLRADHKLLKYPAKFFLVCSDERAQAALEAQLDDFKTLTASKDGSGVSVANMDGKVFKAKVVSDKIKVIVDLSSVEGTVAGAAGADTASKTGKEIEKFDGLVQKLKAKMAKPDYAARVPPHVQAQDQEKLVAYSKKLDDLKSLAT